MSRRSFSRRFVLALASVACLVPLAGAGPQRDKLEMLHGDFSGPRLAGGSIDYEVMGEVRVLSVRVWQVPVDEARVSFGRVSFPLHMSTDGTGTLVLDSRSGQRMPSLKAGSAAAVLSNGQVLMKAELKPVR